MSQTEIFFVADANGFDFFIIFLYAQKATLFSADGFFQKKITVQTLAFFDIVGLHAKNYSLFVIHYSLIFRYLCRRNPINYKVMEPKAKKKKTDDKKSSSTATQEVKQLSKVGEWLKSGQSVGTILDMRAVLR